MRKTRIIAVASLALLWASPNSAQRAPYPFPAGLWVWSENQQPGEVALVLERGQKGWRAWVNGETATVSEGRDSAILVETRTGETWRGSLPQGDAAAHGHWTQPASGLGFQSMATYATVPRVAENRWAARIAVQPRTFHLFLDLFEDENGLPAAVIRNPERNEIIARTRFSVEPSGDDRWALVAGNGENRISHLVTRLDGDRIQMRHPRFEDPLILRRARDRAAYLAGGGGEGPRRYSPPPALNDGWRVATAEKAGFRRAALDSMVAALASSDAKDRRPRLLHSVLAAHKGVLVIEEYFFGHTRDTRHDTRSLAKVFAPVLVGALQARGVKMDSGIRPIPDVLAAAGLPLDNPGKARITLGHLMSFTSGLDCSDDDSSPGSEERMWAQSGEPDFWIYTARLPLLHEPGTRYAYCSGSINLVGSSLRQAGGKPIPQLFDELIARPLEFGPYHWALAPNGAGYLGGGVYMRPRDVLKIGAAYANGGTWNGARIATPEWIAESTSSRIPITPATTGMSAEEFANTSFGGEAAYEWRLDDVEAGGTRYATFEASGNGGQLLIVVPELDLVVVLTGGNYMQGGVWGRWRDEIVGGHIIPAMAGAR